MVLVIGLALALVAGAAAVLRGLALNAKWDNMHVVRAVEPARPELQRLLGSETWTYSRVSTGIDDCVHWSSDS